MFYEFPIINNISDVLPAIKDCPEFIVVEKEGYTVVNYVVNGNDTFPPVFKTGRKMNGDEYQYDYDVNAAIKRECRGIIFDSKTGNILARRLHKFFNLGERLEVMPENVDFNQPHIILEKLDGSMITPFLLDGKVVWGTKLGLTDVAKPVQEFVRNNMYFNGFSKYLLETGRTPIFEWCSRKQRIVIDYPTDDLFLLAIRNIISGVYWNQEMVHDIADRWKIPVVNSYIYDGTLAPLIQKVREFEGKEGVVIAFENGHRLKLKGDWYLRLHKTKEMLQSERDVCNLILNNQLDDLLPVIMDVDKERVLKYQKDLIDICNEKGRLLNHSMTLALHSFTRKEFALQIAPTLHPSWRSLIFSLWDKEISIDITTRLIYDTVLKHTTNNASFAKMKDYLLEGIEYAN